MTASLPTGLYTGPTLADVMPAALASLGDGPSGHLRLPSARAWVVLLVDGMGAESLRAAPAPTLNAMAGDDLRAGFPSTTATSLMSVSTGLPPGRHGVTGYRTYLPEYDDVISWLRWRSGISGNALDDVVAPSAVLPAPSLFTATAAPVTSVMPGRLGESPLSTALYAGASVVSRIAPGDLVTLTAQAAVDGSLTYAYLSEVDTLGHVYGPDTAEHLNQIRIVDLIVTELLEQLPSGTGLFVTADHGMVAIPEEHKLDLDTQPALRAGLRAIAGEPRARHLHLSEGGDAEELRARFAEVCGEQAWVLTRGEAIDAGLFGEVDDAVRGRIGDVVVIARGSFALTRSHAEAGMAQMRGHHGGLDTHELLVPGRFAVV